MINKTNNYCLLDSNRQTNRQKMKPENLRIRFLENSILIDNKILVFSDFHIGYEEYLYGKCVPIRVQLEEIIKKLDRIFGLLNKEEITIREIIILGDLKHEFGEISDSEWRETLKILDYLLDKCDKIILIKGNHDNVLGPIAQKRNVEIKDLYINKEIGFLHGNKWYKECEKCKILVLGHLHSAITLHDEYKKEKFKCFLIGKWGGKEVYILPSFVPLFFGYDLSNVLDGRDYKRNKEEFFIIENKKLNDFKVIVYNEGEDKIYDFGKLKEIIK